MSLETLLSELCELAPDLQEQIADARALDLPESLTNCIISGLLLEELERRGLDWTISQSGNEPDKPGLILVEIDRMAERWDGRDGLHTYAEDKELPPALVNAMLGALRAAKETT